MIERLSQLNPACTQNPLLHSELEPHVRSNLLVCFVHAACYMSRAVAAVCEQLLSSPQFLSLTLSLRYPVNLYKYSVSLFQN
jgi:hypothetical protein